ncbi:TatD family hydrolase [Candidatus Saganbacteria bacterium]|nr:TatD family hydrolase [Candidatus Saganbacteria bacterium]
MFIDTHAHLTMPEYSDLSEVLSRARDAKIEAIINASFDLKSSKEGLRLAKDHDFIYAAIGIHPHDANLVDQKMIEELEKLASDPKVVAIGETGLDYYKNLQPQEVQIAAFRKFLQLAQKLDKPIIIHCREAQDDVMRVLREENQGKMRGVFHCFAGDEKLIKFANDLGFLISFTGNITFKKANRTRELAKLIPLSQIMVETDCPYLAPEPFRGRRNEPAFVAYVAKSLAEIKGITVEELAMETTKNAKKLFKI